MWLKIYFLEVIFKVNYSRKLLGEQDLESSFKKEIKQYYQIAWLRAKTSVTFYRRKLKPNQI